MSLAESHLAQAQRSRKHYALLFLDLDRFKAINDSLGHHVGDLLLQGVSNRLQTQFRQSDIIARLGGDEFVVLITGLENEYDVAFITNNLIKAISKPFADLDGHEVQVSPSIGVALFPRDGHDLDTLVRHADLAMYQSKQAGRGCCTFFDPAMQANASSSFDLEQRLPRAIEANEFILHFQPKLDLHTHHICGLEALIRWQHPVHGLIYPNDFIPLAESTGHIIELGNWVIAAACRQLAEWQAEGLPPLPVAINLSGRQLIDKMLPERIIEHLDRHGLNPALLEVEVTESSLIERIEVAGIVLNKLVTAGIKVALDDFGNGFSSLTYVKTLPIDAIKIDRSFVHDILNSHDDSVIVLSTITLAHNLGIRVIAEGVETPAQLVFLKTGGCDEIQGYHLSRPVAAKDARQWLLNPAKDFL
jgi:diguanylate cyclase (GGDEF)-like protein